MNDAGMQMPYLNMYMFTNIVPNKSVALLHHSYIAIRETTKVHAT